jgi:hypothetical protein
MDGNQNPASSDSANPVQQRATQFAPAAGDAAPPAELKMMGGGFVVLWLAILLWVHLTRQRLDTLRARSARLEKAATAPGLRRV